MPVLRALSRRSGPATAAQIRRAAGTGTEAGVRRALERMAEHGICLREPIGDRTLYSLNHEHVLYDAVSAVLQADGVLVSRLRLVLQRWKPAPLSAVLYGSAARRDGGVDSDVDVLLVRPDPLAASLREAWNRRVHDLRGDVHRWTGNRLQVMDRSVAELRALKRKGEAIFTDLYDDGILLHGAALDALLGGRR